MVKRATSIRRSNSSRMKKLTDQNVTLAFVTNRLYRPNDLSLLSWLHMLLQQPTILLIIFIFTCILIGYKLTLQSRDATYRAMNADFVKRLQSWDAHLANVSIPSARVLIPTSMNKDENITLTKKRTLVIYSYSHASWRQENLEFFLRHGLVTHTADGGEVDYTFVFNGYESPDSFHFFGIKFTSTFIAMESSLEDLLETNISPKDKSESESRETSLPRVHAVFRENSGFDICSSRIVIEYGLAPRSGTYTHLVLLNGSVRGPFLPSYVKATWIDMFQQFLHNNVRLVGTTINCMSDFYYAERGFFSLHVQSMVLALDAVGVRAFLPVLQCYKDYADAINYGEIGMSQMILHAGYGLTALQGSWRGVSIFEKDLNSSLVKRRCKAVSKNAGGDPNHPGMYMDGTVHPLEVIYIKTNRKLDPVNLRRESLIRDLSFRLVSSQDPGRKGSFNENPG
jgi:hypothetical protein